MTSENDPLALLKDELNQTGIAVHVPELVEHDAVIAELAYALRPLVHEGKVQPYGFMVCNCTDSPIYHKFAQDTTFELQVARKLADGCHSFVVFSSGQFRGVFPLTESASTELRLVQLQQQLRAVICLTDTSGTTKIFCDQGVFIHQYRRWQQRPCLKQALHNISQCIVPTNTDILQAILAFCFYELSPQKIGATLVWCLEELNPADVQRLLPNSSTGSLRERIQLDVQEGVDRSILCHILTYTDGAVFLTPEGIVVGGGAHLKYSETSRSLIPAYRGTRHTSAKRFSFDFPETVVFVVSSDGLVTVFSDGMNIVNLSGNAAVLEPKAAASSAEAHAPTPSKADLIECQRCRKTFKIQMVNGVDVEQQIPCPVCSHILITDLHVLEVYVIKQRYRPSGADKPGMSSVLTQPRFPQRLEPELWS